MHVIWFKAVNPEVEGSCLSLPEVTIPLSLLTQPSPGTAPWIRSADTRRTCCSCRPQKPGRTGPCRLWTADRCPCRALTDKQRRHFDAQRAGDTVPFTRPAGLDQETVITR